jgi:hypothetical protein
MMISFVFSIFMLSLSTVATMSTSENEPHHLRKAQDWSDWNTSAERILHFRDVKNHVLFERAMGGKVGSTGGMTPSARAKKLHQQQRTFDALQTNVMAFPRREQQASQGMSFEQFCSAVTVCICPVTAQCCHIDFSSGRLSCSIELYG